MNMSVSGWSPYLRLVVTTALLAVCAGARSEAGAVTTDQAASYCDADCVAVGQWQFNLGLGLGVRSNPLAEGEASPLIVLPEVSYYGRRFFLRNLDMGFTLVESQRHQLNLLLTPSYDQMHFNRWDPLNFTFQGSAASASPATAAPPATEVPRGSGYTYLSVSSPMQISEGGGGPSPVVVDTGEATPPVDSAAPVEPISFSGNVSGDPVLEINGTIITSSATLRGVEGNTIDVFVQSGRVSIDGVSASDALNLRSDNGVQLTSVTGDAWLGGDEMASGGVVAVDLSHNAFIIRSEGGQSEPEPPPADSDAEQAVVPYDAVAKRRMSGLAGAEYSYTTRWLSIHVQALQDFTNIHHGQEYRTAVVFPLELASQRLALTLGANHKSQQVLDYYYGIDAAEAMTAAWQYQVQSGGTETLVRLDWQMPLARQWTLRAKLQYLGLPEEMTRSPLVVEDYVLSAFIGGVYHF